MPKLLTSLPLIVICMTYLNPCHGSSEILLEVLQREIEHYPKCSYIPLGSNEELNEIYQESKLSILNFKNLSLMSSFERCGIVISDKNLNESLDMIMKSLSVVKIILYLQQEDIPFTNLPAYPTLIIQPQLTG